ncbi:MAG: hypothetical protein WC291_10930 [Thermodesulfovibrionales bacterium]|jgi:hypothetical protein
MNNKKDILSNLIESKAALDRMVNEIEKDDDFDFDGYYSDMQHIYHHLNTAWHIRKEKEETLRKCTQEDFYQWRKFPDEFDMGM